MIQNKDIMGMLENLHLLRKLFVRRTSESSPLHFGQIGIMKTIEEHENCTQATIAECLGVSPPSVAVSTKRLQKAGLITKTVDEGNLRCKRLSLTDKGRAAIREHIRAFEEYDSLVFSVLTEEEKEQLMSNLSRLVSRMRELEGIDGDFSSPMELTHRLCRQLTPEEEKGD